MAKTINNNSADSAQLVESLTEIIRTIESVGVEKTRLYLKQARLSSHDESEISNFIIALVCKKAKIPQSKLFAGDNRSENRSTALSFIFCLHKIHLGYGTKDMSSVFEVDQANISKYMKRLQYFETSTIRKDIEILKMYNAINEQVEEFSKTKSI